MANDLATKSPSDLRASIQRLRSRLAEGREKLEEVAIEVGRTGVGGVTTAGMGFVNGYFNRPKVAGIRVDAGAGALVKFASLFFGRIGMPLLGSAGDALMWQALGDAAQRKGLEASAEANELTPLEVITNRENGFNDDGSMADEEAPAEGRPGAG